MRIRTCGNRSEYGVVSRKEYLLKRSVRPFSRCNRSYRVGEIGKSKIAYARKFIARFSGLIYYEDEAFGRLSERINEHFPIPEHRFILDISRNERKFGRKITRRDFGIFSLRHSPKTVERWIERPGARPKQNVGEFPIRLFFRKVSQIKCPVRPSWRIGTNLWIFRCPGKKKGLILNGSNLPICVRSK